MTLTRRETLRLFAGGAATAALWPRHTLEAFAAKKAARFKVGVTDWNLKLEAKPEAIVLAKSSASTACRSASARARTGCR